MRIYLDNCCYNRPYDDLTQLTVSLEAQAKLYIQSKIKNGEYELVTSEILRYEVSVCPAETRRAAINDFINNYSSVHVGNNSTSKVREIAHKIMETGIKYKDACHVASAIIAGCDCLISTDKRLLKYKSDRLKLVDPIEFVRETEV